MSNGHFLVLGGARSGKTAYAERLALHLSEHPAYLATSEARDAEMAARIARHRAERDARFITIEEPLDLPAGLRRAAGRHDLILVDCLTLWLSNLMGAERDMDAEMAALGAVLHEISPARVILVSNEVGLGIVPGNAPARAFRDHAGHMHQRLAQSCENVLFIAAGLPLAMKGSLPPL